MAKADNTSRTEQRLKAGYLTKDAILGWVSLSIIIAMAIIGFQINRDRVSLNDILASEAEQIPRISAAELKSKIDAASDLLVVDVRSKEEYETMHITGSISLPVEEISQHYDELKGYKQIVTYCT